MKTVRKVKGRYMVKMQRVYHTNSLLLGTGIYESWVTMDGSYRSIFDACEFLLVEMVCIHGKGL